MANLRAIHSVGTSLVNFLKNTYPDDLKAAHPCDFRLLSGGELNGKDDFGTTLSLYCYRITMNQHLRNGAPHAGSTSAAALSLDLHFLLTVWASSALAELNIAGWALRQLHMHQTLSQSDLTPEAGWLPDDFVQVIPAELGNEELMRIWDALDPAYRLTVSYIARVVRIDVDTVPDARPVVARQFQIGPREEHQ